MDDAAPRSRRAILAAALGAAAASVAGALGKPAPASATDNQAILAGATNTATKATILNASGGTAGLWVENAAGGGIVSKGTGTGVWAESTVAAGIGVLGIAWHATGPASGVMGTAWGTGGVGAFGASYANSTGVIGHSTNDSHDNPVIPDKTGVYGKAMQDQNSRGVVGETAAGQGVRGQATTGIGVFATAPVGGTALSVNGRSAFSRSGRAVVPAGQRYVDVTVPGGLVSGTFVVATMQTYRSGVWVSLARNNYPSTGKVRIYLNKVASTTGGTAVGWIAIG